MNAAYVVRKPKIRCSVAPETVAWPRLPRTAACRIRGDAPCLVTAIPISLPLTSEPSAFAAAPRLICDPQWWYGLCPAPSYGSATPRSHGSGVAPAKTFWTLSVWPPELEKK